MNRRARTHQLIELGGLVKKSGLADETNDDRALLLGLLMTLTKSLKAPDNQERFEAWREQGRAALNDKKSDRS